ncbi:hypothetical protein Lalb_Chr19g0135051 [Lupinus albus]|uniref:Uncharacterized protein n=1 Tax=Lupinus albus TaxID=3870 RepID=A0A6A4NLM1_LUPAL|nr:hypothetical protein Lalb_Chr19g0135051 [Lupinus albus]
MALIITIQDMDHLFRTVSHFMSQAIDYCKFGFLRLAFFTPCQPLRHFPSLSRIATCL